MLHTIIQISVEPDYRLRLTYADGETILVDFKPLIEQGGEFSKLGNPKIFKQVMIGQRGRYIKWPGEIDFCADALRYQMEPQRASGG
jgi:hypothetical protein